MTHELEVAMARAKAWLANASPEEREAMYRAQRESWARGEMAMRESSVVVRRAAHNCPKCDDAMECDCPPRFVNRAGVEL